jgi:hypothetical protein
MKDILPSSVMSWSPCGAPTGTRGTREVHFGLPSLFNGSMEVYTICGKARHVWR